MDTRSSQRNRFILPVRIISGDNKIALNGQMVNISDNGMCIMSNGTYRKKEILDINAAVPAKYKKIMNDKDYVSLKARIAWVVPSYDTNYRYKYGLQLIKKSSDAKVLKDILNVEMDIVSEKKWKCSHPVLALSTIPLSSKMLEGMRPSALSVDVTNLCNLRCKHCFWDIYKGELSSTTNTRIIEYVKEALAQFPSITNILWYGGEPFYNKQTIKLVEKGTRLVKNNLIITNGTFPIPKLKTSTHIGVSVDGPREVHDRIRGRGTYEKVKRHIYSAIQRGIPIGILYCINSKNINSIPAFLDEWADAGLIEIVFTMYTPVKGKPSEMAISDSEKERLIPLLLEMKKKYPDLIANTETMIKLLHPKYGKELKNNCPMNLFNKKSRVFCLHMCNDGTIRLPCAIGRNADHLRCRSVTKVALYAGKVMRDKASSIALIKMFLSTSHLKHARLPVN